MADRHRDHDLSKEKGKEKEKEKDKEKEKEKEKDGLKSSVEGSIGGCPVLIQTGPNVKVLAQVCTVRATLHSTLSYCIVTKFSSYFCYS